MKLIGLVMVVAMTTTAQDNWRIMRDRRGAAIQVPQGWSSVVEPNSTRINVTGSAGERMSVWPVFVEDRVNAQMASAMVVRVAAKLAPAIQWNTTVAPAGALAVRIGGKANGNLAVCSANWVNTGRGSVVYFVLSEAPQATFAAAVPIFARIFTSLQLSAPETATRQSVRWNDPREQAFSIEAPANWRTDGGTVRRGATDLVHTWSTAAPDGSARVVAGDAEIPTFTLPNQMLAMAGLREGSWYSPGYGVRMMVQRYMPGAAFAKWYVQTRVAPGCTNLQFMAEKDRTQDLSAINAQYAQFQAMGINLQMSAGEVSFRCVRAGQPVSGYYFATTLLTNSIQAGNGIWAVDQLVGWVANPGALVQNLAL